MYPGFAEKIVIVNKMENEELRVDKKPCFVMGINYQDNEVIKKS